MRRRFERRGCERIDDLVQRAAPANADYVAPLDGLGEMARGGLTQAAADDALALGGTRWHDGGGLESERVNQLALKRMVAGEWIADGNLDDAEFARALEQTRGFGTREFQRSGDLFLRLILFVVEAAHLEEQCAFVGRFHN